MQCVLCSCGRYQKRDTKCKDKLYDHTVTLHSTYTMNFLSYHFTNYQFGFISGCSSLQQLLLFINNLVTAKEKSYQVDAIYVDFKKAFDTVSHSILLVKLKSYEINGGVLNFFQAYLTS